MPALHLFHRRTLLAGDDLQLPSLAWGSVSSFQLFLLLPYLLYYTIELLLTTSSSWSPTSSMGNYHVGGGDGGYGDGGDRLRDTISWKMEERRQLQNNYDNANDESYLDYMENQIPNSMQSPACANSTFDYTELTFPRLFLIYLAGTAIYAASSLYYEQRIFQLSSLGTPTMDLRLRAPLGEMIEFKMTYLAGFNVVLLVFGMGIAAAFMGGFAGCFPTFWWILVFVLFFTQVAQCLLILTTLISLWRVSPTTTTTSSPSSPSAMLNSSTNLERTNSTDFYQRHIDALHHTANNNNSQIAEELWQTRCDLCCRVLAVSTCFLFGGRGIVAHAANGSGGHGSGGGKAFYGDIARALADYFADFGDIGNGRRGLDVVPSDVGLGFVMLRHMQAQRKMLAKRDALQQQHHQQQQQSHHQQHQVTGSYGSNSGSESNSQLLPGRSNENVNNVNNHHKPLLPTSPNKTTLLFRWSDHSPARIPSPSRHGSGDPNDSPTLHHHQHHPTLPPPSTTPPSTTTIPPPTTITTATTEEAYRSYSRKVLSPANPSDYALMEEGARFARHQLAIYTWILYYYQYPVTGTFRLIGNSMRRRLKSCGAANNDNHSGMEERSAQRGSAQQVGSSEGNDYETCTATVRPPNDDDVEAGITSTTTSSIPTAIPPHNTTTNDETIVGDNFLHIHETTMLAHANLDRSDIAYASFEAGFYETPYCIIVDRKWKSIVLSIRGSLTLEDCVVDVLLDPSSLEELGEKYGFRGTGQFCHGGVLECSNWLHEDLMRHKILQRLLLGENAEFPDYTLRVVGHSLGAGIGVILSLMLRKMFPNLRCICYSPPGGLLTWELANECSEFVNSFVLDSDIVPRLSLNNMERLRDEVLHLIARVRLSKYEIAQRIFWHGVCGDVELGDLDFLIQQNEDMLHPPNDVPDSDFARELARFETMQRERRSSRGTARSVGLYPPGNITHLVKTGQSKDCLHGCVGCITCGASNVGSEYTPIQKENDDFNEIEISPTLWTDHFPNRVCVEMERIAESFGIDTTLGSPRDC